VDKNLLALKSTPNVSMADVCNF